MLVDDPGMEVMLFLRGFSRSPQTTSKPRRAYERVGIQDMLRTRMRDGGRSADDKKGSLSLFRLFLMREKCRDR